MTTDDEFEGDDDGDFDEDDAAIARFRAAEQRVLNTPPRCLAGFTLEPSPLKNYPFDGHGEPLNKVYRLRCPCGHDRFLTLGHHLTNEGTPIFVSPLALECAACRKVTELIDTDRHGYDAEVGVMTTTIRGTGPRTAFACDRCGVRPTTAHARFEHSGETLEDSTGEWTGNEPNLFTWFSLVGECTGCNRLLAIADFECA
jgi:hypothetical protein